ncbi:nicotinamide N-methyltransferase-like [Hyla sarda]|uniref:nicotinamide N-methyltransferase-like n=1 Tax=Hyla sarda TaxID=327740 RepID=UPI0024C2965A|nr:nicotinamide N-methyltransferase-like [Hyla sarda]
MDSGFYKIYHQHEFDSREHLENYFSDQQKTVFGEDALMFPIESLRNIFTLGHIKADVLIELSSGSMVHLLYAACDFFKHIIVLKVSDGCIMELKRWLDSRTGAFHWGHATKLHADIEGSIDQLHDKEEQVRTAAQHVMKCDFEKENMTDPIVLPPADCIITAALLDVIFKDRDDYIRYLRKILRLLKPGGHLILIGCLDMTYYKVGKDTFHAFKYNEVFARKTLVGEGFIIENCKIHKRTAVSDLTDYKALILIVAHKEI